MKTKLFYLINIPDPFLIEVPAPVTWHHYIAGRFIPSPDLIILIEQFYFPN